jgi:hypothetical protein
MAGALEGIEGRLVPGLLDGHRERAARAAGGDDIEAESHQLLGRGADDEAGSPRGEVILCWPFTPCIVCSRTPRARAPGSGCRWTARPAQAIFAGGRR